MPRLASTALFAALALAAQPLLAHVSLQPYQAYPLPGQHGYIIGLELLAHSPRDDPRLVLFTTQETYSSVRPFNPRLKWQKEFDVTPFNINLFEESSVAIHPTNPNIYYFTGGLSLNRAITFQQSPIAVTANHRIGNLQYIPQNIVVRTSSTPGAAVEVFYSVSGSLGGDSPALYRHSDTNVHPWTSENPFGTSGPGEVTSGVGALRFGTDGLLNVIDTGAQRIVRYDPDTLAYVSEFALGNTHTDRNTFVITPNGLIFTTFTDSAGGAIYSYETGALLGNYGLDTTLEPGMGFGGKTSMTVDPETGLVYVLTANSAGEGLFVYSSIDIMDSSIGTIVSFLSDENRTAALVESRTLYLSLASGSTTQSGVISGSGSVVKTGAGSITLSGSNTYTGDTTIHNGTIVAAFTGEKGTFADHSTVTVNTLGTLAVDGESLGSGAGTTAIILNRGTLTSISTTGQATTLRDVTMTGGLITRSGNGRFILDGSLTTISSRSNARIDADLELRNASFNVAASTHGDVIPLTVTSTLSGSGSFIKNGDGILFFSGTGLYTGETRINGGMLLLGSTTTLAHTSAIRIGSGATFNVSLISGGFTLADGQTLGGSGIITGLVNLSSGARLAPGNSPGTLTFNDGLALADGAILDFELGTTSDLIRIIGGVLSAEGTITVNLTDSGGFTAGTYTLIDATGATLESIGATSFELGERIAGYTYAFTQTGNVFQLIATTAIPEPSTFAALAGLVALALAATRRRI